MDGLPPSLLISSTKDKYHATKVSCLQIHENTFMQLVNNHLLHHFKKCRTYCNIFETRRWFNWHSSFRVVVAIKIDYNHYKVYPMVGEHIGLWFVLRTIYLWVQTIWMNLREDGDSMIQTQ
jgi:hypothetical protein